MSISLDSFTTFGELLRYLRQREKLTQRELSIAVGYSESQINRLEKNLRLPEASIIAVQFVPALHLEQEPQVAARLIELAAQARGEPVPTPFSLTQSNTQRPVERTQAHTRRRDNLPAMLTSFVGREQEMAEIATLLQATRLLTLTGAGGVGKTRLAIEVASKVKDAWEDGSWLIELAPISDPAFVPQVMIQTLRLTDQPNLTHQEALCNYFEDRHALLVIDNCEHVINAIVALIDVLLRRCPRLHVLATSRETLRLIGETTYRVPSLRSSDRANLSLDIASGLEAVQLFEARARAQQPQWRLTKANAASVVRLCEHLDGIPLALELAAALVQTLSVAEMAVRLDDRLALPSGSFRAAMPRHQTMRSTLDWSFDLLTPDEQRALARLSVFAGGWSLDAAMAVAEIDFAVLNQLVHKSLVLAEIQGSEMRYRLLEPIRQYAAGKLDASGAGSASEANVVRRMHAQAFLTLAQAAELQLHGKAQKQWLDRLERDHANFRTALQWSRSETGDAQLGQQLAGILWQFWWMRGYVSEGSECLNDMLAAAKLQDTPAVHARLLLGLATLLRNAVPNFNKSSELRSREQLAQDALTLFQDINDLSGCAWAYYLLAEARFFSRDFSHATALCEESLRACRQSNTLGNNSLWVTSWALKLMGEIAEVQTDGARATSFFEEAIEAARQQEDAQGTAEALIHLGNHLRNELDLSRALDALTKAHSVVQESGDASIEPVAKWYLADTHRVLHQWNQASVLAESLHEESIEHGRIPLVGASLCLMGLIALDQGDYALALQKFRASLNWNRTKLGVGMDVLNLLGLLKLATLEGKHERAATLYGAYHTRAQTDFRANRLALPLNRLQFVTHIDATRAQLTEAAYNTAFEEGRAMTPNQVFDYALADA